jgi:hypothetical protein
MQGRRAKGVQAKLVAIGRRLQVRRIGTQLGHHRATGAIGLDQDGKAISAERTRRTGDGMNERAPGGSRFLTVVPEIT